MGNNRTLALLAIFSFIISMVIWFMSEQKNTRERGELIDKAIAEAESNIKFLQTGRHDAAAQDVTDDAIREMSTGGRQELQTRWLLIAAAPGILKATDERLAAMKKLQTMMETYNAEASYSSYSDNYGSDYDDDYSRPAAPPKQQVISEIEAYIRMLKQGKENSNKLDF
jgi:hypothetical protein